jgi:hypothetical protein
LQYLRGRMQVYADGPDRSHHKIVSQSAWEGYLRNLGVYAGNRAICDGRGTVLADVPTRVCTTRYRAGETVADEFLLWDTAVRTVDGIENAEEEWSRDELADLGALAADGSYSVGPNVYVGERFTIEQCLCAGPLRVRSIHAFDWEGRQCGLVGSRERRQDGEGSAGSPAHGSLVASDLSFATPSSQIEPAAWRSPNVLLDYMMGTWLGKGILLDRASGSTRRVSSKVSLKRTDGLLISQTSALAIDGAGPGTGLNNT